MAINKVRQMSQEGYDKLEKELEHLITVRRSEVAEKLKEARSFGDLSENAEYDEAKNEQGILESRINELESILANAEILFEHQISVDEVGIGSVIKIKSKEDGKVEVFTIVGTSESDPMNGKISDESPIGRASLRKRVGDTIEVEAPGGISNFELLDISK